MAFSSRKSSAPVLRSLSPSPRFCNSPSSSSSAFASSSSSFSSRFSGSLHGPSSPTRVRISSAASPSLRFSFQRSSSPGRSISVVSPRNHSANGSHTVNDRLPMSRRRTCMCSPTTHPGSFRCSLHKSFTSRNQSSPSHRLNAHRSSMTNSLVRIGSVEGDLMKRALAALIRPSSHQQRRRGEFQPRPSRLSVMSRAEDLL